MSLFGLAKTVLPATTSVLAHARSFAGETRSRDPFKSTALFSVGLLEEECALRTFLLIGALPGIRHR